MHYLVTYELAADYLERRPQFRNVHLAHAWKAADEGHLLIGGALADPVDTALIVFTGDSPAAAEEFGPIDIAVNSAARPIIGPIATTELEQIQRSLDVNFLGQVHFVRHMAKAMNDGGSIILISSSSAAQPVLPFFPYACAKAATDCLVRYAALEYGPRGIRVNSILPGPIKTELAAAIFAAPGAEAVFEREIPLGRVGVPQDFADVVLWLAGPGYVSGVNLPVSGGMHLTRAPRGDEMPSVS